MRKVWNLFMAMLLITALVLPVCAAAVNSVRQPGAPVVSEVENKAVTVIVTPLVEQEKASWAVKQEIQTATKALNDGDLTKVQSVKEAVKALNELNASLKPGSAILKPGTIIQPVTPAETVPAETVPGETVPGDTVPGETLPVQETQQWTEIKVENLVVSEVFHVTADQTGVAVTFEAEGIRAGQFLMVMVFVNGEWKVMDFNAVEILEDGKVRITFDQYGTVAFIVDKDEQAKYQAEAALEAEQAKKNGGKNDQKNKQNNGNHYGHDKNKKK